MGEILNQVVEHKNQLQRQKAFVQNWNEERYQQQINKLNQIIAWLTANEGN